MFHMPVWYHRLIGVCRQCAIIQEYIELRQHGQSVLLHVHLVSCPMHVSLQLVPVRLITYFTTSQGSFTSPFIRPMQTHACYGSVKIIQRGYILQNVFLHMGPILPTPIKPHQNRFVRHGHHFNVRNYWNQGMRSYVNAAMHVRSRNHWYYEKRKRIYRKWVLILTYPKRCPSCPTYLSVSV